MKSNKVTFNMIAAKAEKSETQPIEVGDGLIIQVKRNLTLNESMQFIATVVSTCFDDDGDYAPEAFQTAVRTATLVFYGGVEMPKDAAKAYQVLFGTDLYNKVLEAINFDQHKSLVKSAEEKIGYQRDMLVSTAAKNAARLIDKIGEMIEQSSALLKEMGKPEVLEAMNSLSQKLGVQQEMKSEMPIAIMEG